MLTSRQAKLDSKDKRDIAGFTSRVSIIVGIIAAVTTFASIGFTYYFVERVRTQISTQTLALEAVKVDISKATQKTAETIASIDAARLELQRQAASIDAARFDLQRQIAKVSNRNDTKKTEIENQRGKADEVRLASELSKAENELIPVIAVRCNTEKFTQRLVKLHCSFKNNGTHRVSIVPEKFELLDSITQRVVDNTIERLENSDSMNTLPTNTDGSNTYDIYLSEKGDKLKNRVISVKIKVQTDEFAVGRLRETAKGRTNEMALNKLSVYNYIFNAGLVD